MLLIKCIQTKKLLQLQRNFISKPINKYCGFHKNNTYKHTIQKNFYFTNTEKLI